jgi:hypothetical protein
MLKDISRPRKFKLSDSVHNRAKAQGVYDRPLLNHAILYMLKDISRQRKFKLSDSVQSS